MERALRRSAISSAAPIRSPALGAASCTVNCSRCRIPSAVAICWRSSRAARGPSHQCTCRGWLACRWDHWVAATRRVSGAEPCDQRPAPDTLRAAASRSSFLGFFFVLLGADHFLFLDCALRWVLVGHFELLAQASEFL